MLSIFYFLATNGMGEAKHNKFGMQTSTSRHMIDRLSSFTVPHHNNNYITLLNLVSKCNNKNPSVFTYCFFSLCLILLLFEEIWLGWFPSTKNSGGNWNIFYSPDTLPCCCLETLKTVECLIRQIPAVKKLTRWEEYARVKGINKRKRGRMVWDETAKDWRPRWGYRRANDSTKDWCIELPEQAGKLPYLYWIIRLVHWTTWASWWLPTLPVLNY